MSVTIELLDGIRAVEVAAASTRGRKDMRSISLGDWPKWLDAEHSPIREFRLRIICEGMPVPVSVHFVRHSQFIQHYVETHRPDRTGVPRTLEDTVRHTMTGNAQSFIDLFRKRLCEQCTDETILWAQTIRGAILLHPDGYVAALAEFLVPNCVYRGGVCHEMKPCGKMPLSRGR